MSGFITGFVRDLLGFTLPAILQEKLTQTYFRLGYEEIVFGDLLLMNGQGLPVAIFAFTVTRGPRQNISQSPHRRGPGQFVIRRNRLRHGEGRARLFFRSWEIALEKQSNRLPVQGHGQVTVLIAQRLPEKLFAFQKIFFGFVRLVLLKGSDSQES